MSSATTFIKRAAKSFIRKHLYEEWNIALADLADDLSPTNARWMKHKYSDRWFADPFIVDEADGCFIVLVEEYLHSTGLGRLARLTVRKSDCQLLKNETILDLQSHLSFPNPICVNSILRFVYPENSQAGNTKYYRYGDVLECAGVMCDDPLLDPVIIQLNGNYYLLATIGSGCDSTELHVYRSNDPLQGYVKFQTIEFADSVARRAGNAFFHNGKLICPAQICNHKYGTGICLQEVSLDGDKLKITELKRLYPPTKKYPEAFHTFNVWNNTVIIDGYRYRHKFFHNLYCKLRHLD